LISEVLHRRIQGRLAAIAVLFRMHDGARAAAELETITARTLPELMSTLIRGVNRSRRVEEIETPPGLNVDIHGAHECDFVPMETETAVCTLIEEAATNAHRHGHATHLAVDIRRSGDRLLMSCTDDGDGPSLEMNPGLGSRLFDEAVKPTGSWCIQATGIGTTVTFTVPIPESATASQEQQRVHQTS
jgi:two-component sensor histidine kinase